MNGVYTYLKSRQLNSIQRIVYIQITDIESYKMSCIYVNHLNRSIIVSI